MTTARERWGILTATAILSGCLPLRAYEGPRLPTSQTAHLAGDYKIRAGAPLSLLLRQVDGRTLDLRFSAVDLLPGEHKLLVDCVIEGAVASRHSVVTLVEAGERYMLAADTTPGNRECTNVRVVPVP